MEFFRFFDTQVKLEIGNLEAKTPCVCCPKFIYDLSCKLLILKVVFFCHIGIQNSNTTNFCIKHTFEGFAKQRLIADQHLRNLLTVTNRFFWHQININEISFETCFWQEKMFFKMNFIDCVICPNRNLLIYYNLHNKQVSKMLICCQTSCLKVS